VRDLLQAVEHNVVLPAAGALLRIRFIISLS
jgi:hypothetical protein